jgi:GAF domain-containing protein
MTAAEIPLNDSNRLAELYKYELLDTVYEQEFDQIVQLASIVCKVPISLITLVDLDRQWFKAKHGLAVAQTARNVSFCGHAILNDRLFEVKDAVADSRFFDNPLVTGEPNIRYYAGMYAAAHREWL